MTSLLPLQSMPVWLGVAFAALGLLLLGLGVREGWGALRYRWARPVPVRDLHAASGVVTVTGVVRGADDRLVAPLTGHECLAYRWRVTELRTQRSLDGSIGTWGQPGRGSYRAVPFVVDDGTGSVLVDPDGATVRLAEALVTDPVADPTAGREPSVRDVADDLLGVQVHDRQYYEARLDDGETVTVRGRVTQGTGTLDARHVGVSIGGRGTVVEDAAPGAAAGRALRRGVVAAGAGLFVLVVATLFSLVPGI